jgi:hypothetical protein
VIVRPNDPKLSDVAVIVVAIVSLIAIGTAAVGRHLDAGANHVWIARGRRRPGRRTIVLVPVRLLEWSARGERLAREPERDGGCGEDAAENSGGSDALVTMHEVPL